MQLNIFHEKQRISACHKLREMPHWNYILFGTERRILCPTACDSVRGLCMPADIR